CDCVRLLASRPSVARRAGATLALALLALAVLLAAGGHASAAAAPRLLGGLNVVGEGASLHEADRAIASARPVGVQIVRTNVPWAALEPLARGQLDPTALAFTDRLAADAAAAHIKVIMTVASTPCWASSAPASILRRCRPRQPSQATSYP